MKSHAKPLIAVLSFLLVTSPAAFAGNFSGFYVFGDSLSDGGSSASAVASIYKLLGGNCDPSHPCPPYDAGHYSNGPVSAEYMADGVVAGGANPANFFNFAIAGSTTGVGNYGDNGSQTTTGLYPLPGMALQMDIFLSMGPVADGNALYMVWGGANDFLTYDSALGAALNISGYATLLADRGAQTILVPNLPDLSQTPFAQSQGNAFSDEAKKFTQDFNQALADNLNALDAASAAKIIQFDTYSFFNALAQNPAGYGFSNITDACVSLSSICLDATGYLFWDDFHPTTRVHSLLATAMLSQVPLPGAALFFLTGLLGLLFRGVRKSVMFCPRAQCA